MVGRPLIDELAVARRPGLQHPARAAAERLAHGDELGPPALDRPEIPRKTLQQSAIRFTLLPKPIEEQLMEDHRVHRNQLLPLEPADQKTLSLDVIERGQLLLDQSEAL